MSGPDFLDTNVVLYAYDSSAPKKQQVAQGLLREALAGRSVISVQVLAEFSAAVLHKISPAVEPENLLILLDSLSPIKVVAPDGQVVRRAVQAHEQYQIHFYDGMIVAAAEKASCRRIWSEDLNSGQEYFGVRVENPFAQL